MHWVPAYVALGSNLDDPRAQVWKALRELAGLPHTRLEVHSRLYGSKPFGPIAQPDYVNAAAGLLTTLDAETFFGALRALETALGRKRTGERWGPRLIDLDLLVFCSETREADGLLLPHPGIVERNFVLYPLADIAPDLLIPQRGRVRELVARVAPEGIWPLAVDSIPTA